MIAEPLFCRARPSAIRLRETYAYLAELSAHPQLQSRGTSQGTIEVLVPYDGFVTFSRAAARDVEHQLSQGGEDATRPARARSGRLAFAGYEGTDLEAKLGLSARHDNVPLEIPVRGAQLADERALGADDQVAVLRLQYQPRAPRSVPLVVTVRVRDEDVLDDEFLRRLFAGDDVVASALAADAARQVGFRRSLLVELEIDLLLAARVEEGGAGLPTLRRLALQWPASASPRGVHAEFGPAGQSSSVALRADPLRRRIECGPFEFVAPTQREPGAELYRYRLPPLRILVDQPGELERRSLAGELEVELPGLLSGLRVQFFEATGRACKDATPQASTRIDAELRLGLEQVFERRTFAPYQQLQFEGVIPDPLRLLDIQTLLGDRGFEARVIPLARTQPAGVERERHLVCAARQEGAGQMHLFLFVEGSRARTLRRTQIPGGKSFETEVDTGNTVVYLRGQVDGDSARLIREMNEIQRLLKNRFRHVSTIE